MTAVPDNELIAAEIAILRQIGPHVSHGLSAEDLSRGAKISRTGLSPHGCFIDFLYSDGQPEGPSRTISGNIHDNDCISSEGLPCSFGFIAYIRGERIVLMELFSYGCEFPTKFVNIEVEVLTVRP